VGLEDFIKSNIWDAGREPTEQDFIDFLDQVHDTRPLSPVIWIYGRHVDYQEEYERRTMRHIDEEKMLRKLAVKKAVKLQNRIAELHRTIETMQKNEAMRDREFREKWDAANVQQQQHQERLLGEVNDYKLALGISQEEIANLKEAVTSLETQRAELQKEVERSARLNDAANMETGQLRSLVANMRDATSKLVESESELQRRVAYLENLNANQAKTITELSRGDG
jgi:chromosome segregation ATPase